MSSEAEKFATGGKNDFGTLVFFDVESTGLASSTSKPRIMEMALVAIRKEEFLNLEPKLKTSKELEVAVGRVINKLVLCFDPSSTIMPHIGDMTGLDNFNLESQENFTSKSVKLLQSFLDHLSKPICVVAHNGNRFDFPILSAELSSVGLSQLTDFSTIDSLEAFRVILNKEGDTPAYPSNSSESLGCVPIEESPAVFTHQEVFEDSQSPSLDSTPIKRSYRLPLTPPGTSRKRGRLQSRDTPPQSSFIPVEEEDNDRVDDVQDYQSWNESTPDRSSPPASVLLGPEAPIKSRKFAITTDKSRVCRAKKRLFSAQPPKSFSLKNLHMHFFGNLPSVSHGAESDCEALLRVCGFHAKNFFRYAQENSRKFSTSTKMW